MASLASTLLRSSVLDRRPGRPARRRPTFRLVAAALLLAPLLAVGPSARPALAATIVVTSALDISVNNDGLCTLREAIFAANTDAAPGMPGECSAGTGADTITFNIGGGGIPTINVGAGGLPAITAPVTIDGTTQPQGGAPASARRIELNGAGAGAATDGLRITAGSGSVIRGLAINRFNGDGIAISGGGGHTIAGNVIGLDPTSTAAGPGNRDGVFISGGTGGNTIGGTTAADRNVISANTSSGVVINSANNTVFGNYIGTDLNGGTDLGNGQDGVLVVGIGATGNTIGGTVAGAGNVISGNSRDGVRMDSARTTVVQGNLIGTQANGTAALGNSGAGVRVLASNNTIGGMASGAGNTIAFNGEQGVRVGVGVGNQVRGNAIFSNTLLGIDLDPVGVTPNDAGDGDTGANSLQNFPLLSSAASHGAGTTVVGTLASTANTTFALDFFASSGCDLSGNGEGQTFLGTTSVTTDAAGSASFSAAVGGTAVGQRVTATATNTTSNDTSEFSGCVAATQVPPPAPGAADLAVTATAAPVTVAVNGAVTYSLTAANVGGTAAPAQVRLILKLPPSITAATATSPQGTCLFSVGTPAKPLSRVLCSVGSVAPGAMATATVTVNPPVAGPLPATAIARPAVGQPADPVTTNDRQSVSVTVTP